jgi:hypothetical protein
MSNTPPDIADDYRNNCPITINYVNKISNSIANSKFLVEAQPRLGRKRCTFWP